MARAELTLFAHLATRPEAELDLAQAALLIAEEEYPGLDIAQYLEGLDDFGAAARQRLGPLGSAEGSAAHGPARLLRVVDYVYRELRFCGNAADYYDPRNSWLSDVLDRRTGIPITLAVVLLEVLARAGVEAAGVCFPGHFLVRAPGPDGPLFVDPFDGRLLSRHDLRQLHGRIAGEPSDPDPRLLEPASKRQVLVRMLHNLRGIFAAKGDRGRLRAILERLCVLTPAEELRQELARLGGELLAPPKRARIFN